VPVVQVTIVKVRDCATYIAKYKKRCEEQQAKMPADELAPQTNLDFVLPLKTAQTLQDDNAALKTFIKSVFLVAKIGSKDPVCVSINAQRDHFSISGYRVFLHRTKGDNGVLLLETDSQHHVPLDLDTP
jgi:hypothetical protein